MRKLLLWFVMFLVFTIAQASSTDAIEVFIGDCNSISLSSNGKILYLNIASGAVIYDISNRITKVGNISVNYSPVNRVIKIGNMIVSYDPSNRIAKIGNTEITYDFAGRTSKIGDAVIAYDVISRVINIAGKIPDNIRLASGQQQ